MQRGAAVKTRGLCVEPCNKPTDHAIHDSAEGEHPFRPAQSNAASVDERLRELADELDGKILSASKRELFVPSDRLIGFLRRAAEIGSSAQREEAAKEPRPK